MLRKYINSKEVIIPYTDNRYLINTNGVITDTLLNKEISDSSNAVEISLFNKTSKFTLTKVVIKQKILKWNILRLNLLK